MKATVERVARRVALRLEEVDISADPALERRYGTDVPVLFVDGKKAAKYRITEDELVRMLAGRRG
jgi:hypothetical protein